MNAAKHPNNIYVTNETKEIAEMASSLPVKEMSVLKAFIAGLEAGRNLVEKEAV